MSVLVIAGSKGGPGKTTVARALCAELAKQEVGFAVVDADPTLALHRWVTSIYEGSPFRCEPQANEDRLAHLLDDLRKVFPLVLVDTPGFHNLASSVAIASADAVLVPCRSSEPDLYEARATAMKVRALSTASRREIPVRILLNGVRGTGVAAHAAAEIKAAGLDRLTVTLGHRAAYEEMTHTGRAPHTGEAWREIDRLVDELRELGWLPDVRTNVKTAVRGVV